MTGALPAVTGGSSPLARGLQGVPLVLAVADRIIPARAGFTAARSAASARCADHPRSRGVYSPLWEYYEKDEGSSPLARGLRARRGGRALGPRIIPARAGFTLLSSEFSAEFSDHPRSRGVYANIWAY